ncbi:hemerythrin domain-containing protein [Paraburkholderia lycopersici]|uniref:Hemerythrin HHE cation binding domain-containing protein n=1 Tax=Paraburkholderia lycopersici TaxID=416944 RepID=A0A1G6S1J6_9BURK|nr:hemerythrin domain-containing protein [Paraburkholderia lycopersici]SDD10792.1 Hemerythrin HHE cation binding domain-containing protein [Paraburkholderia lycopersici]
MSIVTTLKHEHQEIFKLLEKVQTLGLSDEGRKYLKQARSLVVGHLAREDSKLYPQMLARDQTRELAASFASEMKNISKETLSFFDALERGESGLDFARQMGGAIAHLRQRMTREEVRLYPAFDRHCA